MTVEDALAGKDVIVALDVPSRSAADRLVGELGSAATCYKVGLQTLVAAGPALATDLIADGRSVFLDLKLHEVPNSVAGAVAAAGDLGGSMVTVHASGGGRVLEAAVRAAEPFPDLHVLALTVITSLGEADLPSIGVHHSMAEQVQRLASLALATGCHGVVCSVHEAAAMRSLWGPAGLVVTPGIGLETGSLAAPDAGVAGDQMRVGAPEHARRVGASHIVLGRSVTAAPDPLAALRDARRGFLGNG